jgi:predicted N-acetyltransferase YhbS
MPDMLVKLYELPDLEPVVKAQAEKGVAIRRAIPHEMALILEFVETEFNRGWRCECEISFNTMPPRCFIAEKDEKVVGFAVYDSVWKGYFGPTGVGTAHRQGGIGTTLLLATLHEMRRKGYGYGIIGLTASPEYYEKTVKATAIEGSKPGMFKGMIWDTGKK